MLPKRYRLTFRKGERKKTSGGARFKSDLFDLVVSFKPEAATKPQNSQWGFIVSKRVSPKAVERNRLKRLLGESVRYFLPKVRPGFELIILGKQVLVKKTLEEIKKEMECLFKKAGLLKG